MSKLCYKQHRTIVIFEIVWLGSLNTTLIETLAIVKTITVRRRLWIFSEESYDIRDKKNNREHISGPVVAMGR